LAASRRCHCQALLAQRIPRTTLRAARIASYTTTPRLLQDAFHTQLENAGSASFLSSSTNVTSNPQTLTEKIVQRYAVGLAPGKKVKAGDYVTLVSSNPDCHSPSGVFSAR
jgi:homoaconitate hydratase